MRYLKLYESFEDIHEICKQYNIINYTINQDGSIDTNGNVFLYDDNLIKLPPLKFNKINGSFVCSKNKLTSLEGSPIELGDAFYCSHNRLTSFQYAPKIIRGRFDCDLNKIKTFEYFPNYVKGYFRCDDNPIWEVWNLFRDTTKIELLNDFDIFRDEHTDTPGIIMDRLNDFLLTIGKKPVEKVYEYKNI